MNKQIFCLIGVLVAADAMAFTGTEIMNQNEDRRKIDTVHSAATLTTGGGGSPERIKQFTWWRKLTADRTHFNTLTRFRAPAEIRGEGILFLESDNDNNEVLMYLPNFKKIRRVESQQQSGSFMGSEFSYSDIATPHAQDYQQKLLKEETCPGEGNSALQCYVVESLPISDSIKERTGYSKTITWIRKDNFMGAHGEYYNLDGHLVKKLDTSDTQLVDSQKNKWMAHKIRIENAKNGRYTFLQFKDVKVSKEIPDATFTQQNLSRAQ